MTAIIISLIIWYIATFVIILMFSSVLSIDCETNASEQGIKSCKNVKGTAQTVVGILVGGPPTMLILRAVLNRG